MKHRETIFSDVGKEFSLKREMPMRANPMKEILIRAGESVMPKQKQIHNRINNLSLLKREDKKSVCELLFCVTYFYYGILAHT
jgi:hypothetical protein